jgi:hypothetical protein
LAFKTAVDLDPDAHLSAVNDSHSPFSYGLYKRVSRPCYRPIGSAPAIKEGWYVKTINETIDASVFDRWRSDKSYRPPNLLASAKQHAIDPSNITGAVRADDTNVTI